VERLGTLAVKSEESDFLVLGSGIAGLMFALKASDVGSVRIITKKEKAESNTNYAQGGIAAAVGPFDSLESHVADTLDAGAGLCDQEAVGILVREGPERIQELERLGTRFTRQEDGELDLGREGGHSRNRIVHAADLTGREVERALLAAIAERPGIVLHEHYAAVELITDHHLLPKRSSPEFKCYGVYGLDTLSGEILTILAHRTMLATGGCGQVYLHTTNPQVATGDGYGMAFRAGAALANMEFVQFHPTSLYNPTSRNIFLISEAVRGHGGILRTHSGERFMSRYDERLELAPRDIVARAIDRELKHSGEDCVFLDVSHIPRDEFRRHFPNIEATCSSIGLDVARDWIPVVPAAHYQCGGVSTDTRGRTPLRHLYASGEVASTGVHGANRLASNSLLEGLVFSHRSFLDIRAEWDHPPVGLPDVPAWNSTGTFSTEEWIMISHDRREIQQLMWDYVGIVRSDARLLRAQRRIRLIRDEIEDYFRRTRVTLDLLELRNLAETALLIVESALLRKESRGLHYTTDYPERDDLHWRRDTILEKRPEG
jgi:L-aspartate oxidase